MGVTSPGPFVDKIEDEIAWNRNHDTWLGNFEKAIGT
jgi:hypothetical protein